MRLAKTLHILNQLNVFSLNRLATCRVLCVKKIANVRNYNGLNRARTLKTLKPESHLDDPAKGFFIFSENCCLIKP